MERACPWPAWRTHSAQLRAAECIPKSSRQWTSRPHVTLSGVPDLPRLHDILDTCFAIAQKANPNQPQASIVRNLWCDLSQAVQRRPWSKGLRTAVQNSVNYSFQHDCVLSGAAHMRLLGWSKRRVATTHLSDREFRGLAGESLSLVWATVLHGLLYSNPYGSWWPR